ncbi:glycosyltransferase [Photobacterium carnosum]|uniref:glycosyltransferase n=1 Tax=Photobacterium carnosum TaxID=2023717 RepID=UPI001F471958|nr:glycosyltransferase [Photobacterium carnosum]MCF2155412.1 glycosyltransferase [Photobacterium carnosum]MCF2217232.1 glycosyltransferase [Photobacterium carnosum]
MFDKLIVPNYQDEIINKWKYKEKIYISCVCTVFNQKDYIRDAIDGFLSQETEYRFEIIIHDDASTDGTRDILLEYKKRYPLIIKLVLQEENQYSQGRRVFPLAVEHASGEYIALCEGDDFWIDKHKLQKQIVELEKNKDINLVISKAISLYPDGTTSDFCDLANERKVIPFEECILGPKKDFFPTASFFLRKKIFDELPDWFYTDAPVGDYYIQLFAAKYNGVIYLPEATTVYRRDTVGSWSVNVKDPSHYFEEIKKRMTCKIHIIESVNRKYEYILVNKMFSRYYLCILMNFMKYNNKINNIIMLIRILFKYPVVILLLYKKIRIKINRMITK